jgi:hypothetical protein
MQAMPPITEYRLTDHVRLEMQRRGIIESQITEVLAAPEQVEVVRPGRAVYQSRVAFEGLSKAYLLRVFVDFDRQPPEVVTVYRTSKIEKYWRDVK